MPGASRVSTDSAGGTIIEAKAPKVYVNGNNVAVLGCAVAGHGVGEHAGPVMAQASPNVYAQGIAVCRQGDSATCGHAASGSGNVFVNG